MLPNSGVPNSPGPDREETARGDSNQAAGSSHVIVDIPRGLPHLPSAQEARVQVNTFLVRYGHIIPLVAVFVCLLVSSIISIDRQVKYSNANKHTNESNSTTAPNTTLAPVETSVTPTEESSSTVVPVSSSTIVSAVSSSTENAVSRQSDASTSSSVTA